MVRDASIYTRLDAELQPISEDTNIHHRMIYETRLFIEIKI